MTRFAYALLWWLATPFVSCASRGARAASRGYLERCGERFGSTLRSTVPRIWITPSPSARRAPPRRWSKRCDALSAPPHPPHAHDADRPRRPDGELFGDAVERAWLPYDHGFASRRFLAHFAPASAS
jgi:3-deoxy-D-manno-octulosonic-acid transferase